MKKILLSLVFSLIFITSTNYAFAQLYEDPLVILETTQGEIVIDLFRIDAPNHSENFLLLSKTGYYDGTLFHRIIPGFMIQSGDPNSIIISPWFVSRITIGSSIFVILNVASCAKA